MSLNEELKKTRPNLSELSVKAYSSTLRNLYKKVFGEGQIKLSNFKKHKEILNFLKDVIPQKRKSILSALVVLTDKDEYRKLMSDDINAYNDIVKTQEKSDKTEKAWVTQDQIKKKLNALKKEATKLYDDEKPSMNKLNKIQDYVILSLYYYIAPRRLLDYTEMMKKGKNDDKNYIDGNEFVFNRFKGSSSKEQQRIKIPKELMKILDEWIEINPTDYLLFDSNGKQLNPVKLNQRLNKIFGKKTSVNALRKSYLTEKYGDMINKNKEMNETFEDMGSSSKQFDVYVKKED